MSTSVEKQLDALNDNRQEATIEDSKEQQQFNYVSSISEVISGNCINFFKMLIFGLLCLTIAYMIPIIVNYFHVIEFCDPETDTYINVNSNTSTWAEREKYVKKDTVNWILMALVQVYRAVIASSPYLWYYPSILHLKYEYWRGMKIFTFSYEITIGCVNYFVLFYNVAVRNVFGVGAFGYFGVLSACLLIFIVSICYGYNAARMFMPMLIFSWYMILFIVRIYPSIVRSFGETTAFAMLYPYLISIYEAIGLIILNWQWNTLPRKQNLIKCCNCHNRYKYNINWPWFCCCGTLQCSPDVNINTNTNIDTPYMADVRSASSSIISTPTMSEQNRSGGNDEIIINNGTDLQLSTVNSKSQTAGGGNDKACGEISSGNHEMGTNMNRSKCHICCGSLWHKMFRSQISSSVDFNETNVVDSLFSNQVIYFLTTWLIVFAESLRVLSFLQIALVTDDDSIFNTKIGNGNLNLIIAFISNVISEILSRNNLNYKTLYWLINKIGTLFNIKILKEMENPPLSRVYAIYFGAKYHVEYWPLLIILICNITNFGPSSYCINTHTPSNIDVNLSDMGYWILVVALLMQFASDAASEIARNIMINRRFIDKNDPRHRIIHVALTYTEFALIAASVSVWIETAIFANCVSEDVC